MALLATAHCDGTGTNLADLANRSPFSDGGNDAASLGAGQVTQDPFAGAPAYAGDAGATTHNPGLSCITAGCHALSGGTTAPDFFLGGTVFTDYTGTTPAVGVEIRVADANGNAVSAYTGPTGTFFIAAANAKDLTFPVVVGARSGGTERPMITQLGSTQTSCSQQSCHVSGGGPTSDAGNYYPIHVP
jgi:hypothetical protein